MATEPFLGIDFGTTNSVMAWIDPDTREIDVITNAEGQQKTPSVVHFGTSKTLVGTPAVNLIEDALQTADRAAREDILLRTVRSIKRSLVEPPVQCLPSGDVQPHEVVAEILKKLKRDADKKCRRPIVNAVLAHPVNFSRREKDVLQKAAKLAGFENTTLVEEPVAAARAFVNEHPERAGDGILIYDLGGGTFDLAFLRSRNGVFEPAVPPGGDARCGGDDFDQALYLFCDEYARKKLEGPIHPESGQVDLAVLRDCQKRKEALSSNTEIRFSSMLSGGRILSLPVRRAEFEDLIREKVEQTVHKTNAMVQAARKSGHETDTLVLIGGSSRVPLVAKRLGEVVGLKAVGLKDRDRAVAIGAAYIGRDHFAKKVTRRSAPVSRKKPASEPTPKTITTTPPPRQTDTKAASPMPVPLKPASLKSALPKPEGTGHAAPKRVDRSERLERAQTRALARATSIPLAAPKRAVMPGTVSKKSEGSSLKGWLWVVMIMVFVYFAAKLSGC